MTHPTTWKEEFAKLRLAREGGMFMECGDYETMYKEIEDFIESLIKKEMDEKLMKISLEISSIAVQSNNLDLSTGLLEAVRIIDSRLSNNK